MNYFRSLLIMAVIVPAWLSFSDTIYLKNGESFEGVVMESNGDEILVQTAGGRFSFNREAIDRIEKSSPLENLLSKARVEEMRGNHQEAIEVYAEAENMASSEEEKQEILQKLEKSIEKYLDEIAQHDPLTQGLGDIRQIEEIKRLISDSQLLSMLQSAKMDLDNDVAQAHYKESKKYENNDNYLKAIEHFQVVLDHYPNHPLSQNLPKKISNLYLDEGMQQFKRGRDHWNEAEMALQNAVEYQPDQTRGLYYLGQIAMNREEYEDAQEYFSQVNVRDLTPLEANRFRAYQNRVEEKLKSESKEDERSTEQPTPTPIPTQKTTDSSNNGIAGWFGGLWNQVTGLTSGIWSGSGEVFRLSSEYVWYVLVAFGVLIGFWYIPMKIVMADLPKRKVVYHNWRTIMRYLGMLGLIWYFIDRMIREEPRQRCPACNRAIDSYELYENYDFEVCPFCETQIKPLFTMPNVIQMEAEHILKARQNASGQEEAHREMMQRLIQMIMIHGYKIRASDIHIEPDEKRLLIRYRVDGVLTESITIPLGLLNLMVSCIKIFCNLNIAEKRLPQDGHFRRIVLGDEMNVRVSTIPTRVGEKVVLRLLDQKIATATLDQLGMREEALQAYQKAIKSPHGLILATGPTGSGKTTLQYASLQYINDGTKNIVTVEDPIEYELEGINQIQHNQATGLTFATALRSILRQDPDVIMVGEIRDQETATIAINSALTGHMVLSTLHTIDTSTALSRLIDIGVEVKQLSSAVLAIVAQRLVRKLCPHCKKSSSPTAKELKQFGQEAKFLEGQRVYRSRGCRECSNTGFIGRTGIYEVLIPNQEVRQLIEQGASTTELRRASQKAGMKTLREEGARKVLAGTTSLEEVIRVTTDDVFNDNINAKGDETTNIISLEGNG